MKHILLITLTFGLVFSLPPLSGQVSLEFGTGSGKVGYINQNTNPGDDIPVPFGPYSFRVAENLFWVIDTVGNKIIALDKAGSQKKEIRYADAETKILADDFAPIVSASGKIEGFWIINSFASNLLKVTTAGEVVDQVTEPALYQPMKIEVDAAGNLIVSDDAQQKIIIISEDKKLLGTLEYQWSGFTLAGDSKSVYRLHYDQENKTSSVMRQQYDGKILAKTLLAIGDHMNPTIWDATEEGFAISWQTDAPPAKSLHFGIFDYDGNPGSVTKYNLPVAMTRSIGRSQDGKYWVAEVDYRVAPEGSFRIIPMH